MARLEAERSQSRSKGAGTIPPWEWALAGVGGLIFLGAIGYMTFHGLAYPETPPHVVVDQVGSTPIGSGFLLRFRASNLGNSTAAAIRIRGQLVEGATAVETRDTQIDYLPQQSERLGGLFFSRDPSRYQIILEAEGYAEP
jgi:uncharacterized protein (TIGR02588 family)